MSELLGCDVSAWQPNVDWAQVKASGRIYAFCKASEGVAYKDSWLAHNRAGTAENGFLLTGLYHYAHHDNDPTAEARHFLAIVGTLAPHEIPVLDSEGPAVPQAWAAAWAAVVEQATGKRPVLYCNTSDFRTVYGGKLQAGFAWWWAAQYSNSPPTNPAYTFWQYTDRATVPGVPGRCDDNKFFGTEDDLRALVDAAPFPPPDDVPTPMSQLERAIARLLSQVGVGETPPGSNHVYLTDGTDLWEWFRQRYGLAFQGGAWCGGFMTWGLDMEGVPHPALYNVPALQRSYQAQGRFFGPHDGIRGDLITFDWEADHSPDHVGMILTRTAGGYRTVEGNTSSNKVEERDRPFALVYGVCRPDYTEGDDDMPFTEAQLRAIIRSEIKEVVPHLVDEQLNQHGLAKSTPAFPAKWADDIVTRVKAP